VQHYLWTLRVATANVHVCANVWPVIALYFYIISTRHFGVFLNILFDTFRRTIALPLSSHSCDVRLTSGWGDDAGRFPLRRPLLRCIAPVHPASPRRPGNGHCMSTATRVWIRLDPVANELLSFSLHNVPYPPLDNIRVMVIVWRLRGNIIRTAPCWVVWHNVHSQQHTHMSSSYRSSRLGLSHWDPYAMHRGGCLELYYCNMVDWCWWDSGLICKTNWFPSVLWHCWSGHMTCKNRPRYDL